MTFDKLGRLELSVCSCGTANIDGHPVSVFDIRKNYGNRDIRYSHGIHSKECGKIYYDADITDHNTKDTCGANKILIVGNKTPEIRNVPSILEAGGFSSIETANNGNAVPHLLNNHFAVCVTESIDVIAEYKRSPRSNGTEFVALINPNNYLNSLYSFLGTAVVPAHSTHYQFINTVRDSLVKRTKKLFSAADHHDSYN